MFFGGTSMQNLKSWCEINGFMFSLNLDFIKMRGQKMFSRLQMVV